MVSLHTVEDVNGKYVYLNGTMNGTNTQQLFAVADYAGLSD